MKLKHTQKKSARKGRIKPIIRGGKTLYTGYGPYIKPLTKERSSFTKDLRIKRGYVYNLNRKYSNPI